MAISQHETTELQCPSCGRPFEAAVWLVVDRRERPDLVTAIMDGVLNVAACPHCQAEGAITHPLLLHDPTREQVVVALPLSVQGAEAARELTGDLLRRLLDALPSAEHAAYLGEIELVPELDGLRALLIEQALAENTALEDQLLAVAIQELLNVGSELDFQRVIAEHRRVLLSERADESLDEILHEARRQNDQELRRRAREGKAVLSRLRGIVSERRSALRQLLDELAPLEDDELAVLPTLRRMLDAVDPQEVYQARIGLDVAERTTLDRLIERLAEHARLARQTDALRFLGTLAALPER